MQLKALRKNLRRFIARPRLQSTYRLLHRFALAGMNYGGAGSARSSGDEHVLRYIASRRPAGRPIVVLDVGANVGAYVAQVLRFAGEQTIVHALEPSSVAFARLRARFEEQPQVHLHRVGIGSEPGTRMLYAASPGSVLASTYVHPLENATAGELVEIVTLDAFCAKQELGHVDLLKLDLEGGEVDALRGARGMLQRNAFDAIQFEFGQPSIGSRTFFADLFSALDAGYQLYRVLPGGFVPVRHYHETLEVFMSTNYLALSRSRR